MKQCPVCEKEFDDSLRFCQVDGTPLVDKTESVDPFKTMVASKADIAAAMPPLPSEPAPPRPSMPEPSVPAPIENELLEIPPAADPNKTQFVSEAELRAEMAARSEDQVIDVPPIGEPEPPKFVGSEAATVIGGAPPPSPFSTPNEPAADEPGPANFPTSPPIPSPFSTPPKADEDLPETPSPFAESASPEFNPFEPAPAAPIAQAEVSSLVVPESNMQNPQDFGQNAPFNAPLAAGGGQNQTLAIVSLVVGILSLFCCTFFIPGLIAAILGFVARGKANSDPANYGGAGLALGGIITGVLSLLLGVIAIILYVFMGVGASMMQNF